MIAEIQNLSYQYHCHKGRQAVDHISFYVQEGECVGLIGESGSGKSTTGMLLAGLLNGYQGEIQLFGQTLANLSGREKHQIYQNVQMVFQDPWQSFSPHMTVGEGVREGLLYYKKELGLTSLEIEEKVLNVLEMVGLDESYYHLKCRQLSGGECQRAAIARAIIRNPKLIICDEMTSALDVSIQAQIVQLIARLKKNTGISFLFISHDLALVGSLCDRVYVLKEGKIIEELPGGKGMYQQASHAYTKQLMDAVLTID